MAKAYIYTLRVILRDETDPKNIAFPTPLEESGEKDSLNVPWSRPVIDWDITDYYEERAQGPQQEGQDS